MKAFEIGVGNSTLENRRPEFTSRLNAEHFPSLRKSISVSPLKINISSVSPHKLESQPQRNRDRNNRRRFSCCASSSLSSFPVIPVHGWHRSALLHCSPHPPQISTMASSQPPKGRDHVLSTLNVLIQALDIAKDVCGIPPAQIALGSASALLTMIRVRSPILCEDEPLTRVFLGHDVQRPGLRRAWTGLCWCMPNTLQEIEGKTIG
jgi:hypothetical protein